METYLLIGMIAIGIICLAMSTAMFKKKNKEKSSSQRRADYFDDYDRRMDEFRRK